MEKKYAVRLDHVSKKFGEELVVRDVTQNFEQGLTHGIVGFNGSGKTVLLKCICGYIHPTGGSIYVNDREVGKEVDFPQSMGLIIESPGFLGNYSGIENLKMLAAPTGKASIPRIRDTMKKVGLDPDSKKKVSQYSLGMRQRLGLAQALMEDPELLILDEPFNGLDKKAVQEMYGLVRELKERGKTIFLTSHNAEDIRTLCDRIFEMDAGVMRCLGEKKKDERTIQNT